MESFIQKVKFQTKELVYRNIKGKKVLILFVITNLVYAFMLMVTIPMVMNFSDGMKLFDMMPMGYDPSYAVSLLEKLGVEGRNAYLYRQIPVDLIYPFLFAISYGVLLGYLLNKVNGLKNNYFYLCLVPVFAGFFDYMENFGIVNMILSYPDLWVPAIHLTNFFTIMKSLLSTINFSVLIVLLIIFGVKKIISKRL